MQFALTRIHDGLEQILESSDKLINQYDLNDIEKILADTKVIQKEIAQVQPINQIKINQYIQPSRDVDDSFIQELLKDQTLLPKLEAIIQSQDLQEQQYIIDYIDQLEKQPYKIDNIQEFQSLLFNQQYNMKVNSFLQIKLPKIYELLTQMKERQHLKCIAVFQNQIAFGTLKAQVYIVTNKIKKLESDSSITPNQILCMRFTQCGQYLIAMSQTQLILYYQEKLCKVFSIDEGTPLSLCICGEFKKNTINFIFSVQQGGLWIGTIRKSLLSYSIEKKQLFSNTHGVFHQTENNKIDMLEVVAVSGKTEVFVISVEPMISVLFKRICETKQRHLCQVKWQQDSRNLILGYNNIVEIICMEYQIKDGRISTSFKVLNKVQMNQNDMIQGMMLLSECNLFLKCENKRYGFINLNDETGNIIMQGQLTREVMSQKFMIGQDQYSTFSNTIVQLDNKFFFIEEEYVDQSKAQFLILYQLINWKDYAEDLISKFEWNQCLQLLLNIYLGKENRFAGLYYDQLKRKVHLRPILNDILYKYVDALFDKKKDNQIMVNAIEFLIKIESFDYLFKNLRQFFIKQNKDQQFLDNLEPFILQNQVKYIPDEAIKSVMSNLKQKKKLQTLKQLIINLDIKQLDSIYIQQLCIEYNLFTPLIYISPRVDDDYKTPLFKMFAVYSQLVRESKGYKPSTQIDSESHMMKYFTDLQIDIPKNLYQISREIKIQGYRCIWYMHMCFTQELFPNQKLDNNRYHLVVSDILQWVLQYDTLRECLQIDPYCMLYEFLYIFKEPQINIITAQQDVIIKDLVNSKIVQNIFSNLSECFLDVLYSLGEQFKNQIQLFTLELMRLKQNILYKHFQQAIYQILDNPYCDLYSEAINESSLFFNNGSMIEKQNEERFQNNLEVIITYVFQQIDKQLINRPYSISQEQEIIVIYLNQQISSVCLSEMYFWIQNYKECIYQLLQIENVRVFQQLERILSILDGQERDEFLNFIITIIPTLVVINAESLSQLLIHYDEEGIKQTIKQLNSNPQLKLKLIDKIVYQKRNRKELIEDDLMIQFFSLVCQFHKQQAYDQLCFGDFPQDPCLEICKQEQILNGMAYIKQQQGHFQEALNFYFDHITVELEQFLKSQRYQRGSIGVLQEWLQVQVHPCLQLCRNGLQKDEDQIKIWFQTVKRMVQLRQQYETFQIVFKVINDTFQIMLEELLERVELGSIISNIKLLFDSFKIMEDLKRTFTKLLSSQSFEILNLQYQKQIQEIDFQQMLDDLYMCQLKGTFFIALCSTCMEFKDINLLGFVNCSHIYHLSCTSKVRKFFAVCETCLDNPTYRMQMQLEIAQVCIKTQVKQMNNDDHYLFLSPQPMIQKQEQYQMTKEELKSQKINKLKILDFDKEERQAQAEQLKLLY
ncbi:hypothetical protein pb186bvf_010493 [Paramecium bursaria]